MRQTISALTLRLGQLEVAAASGGAAAARRTGSMVEGLGATSVERCYILFDLETSGIGATEGIRVCQIAGHAFNRQWRSLGRFTKFVNPMVTMDEAVGIHGITNDRVRGLASWEVVGKEFHAWMEAMRTQCAAKDLILSAHNGKRYGRFDSPLASCRSNARSLRRREDPLL